MVYNGHSRDIEFGHRFAKDLENYYEIPQAKYRGYRFIALGDLENIFCVFYDADTPNIERIAENSRGHFAIIH